MPRLKQFTEGDTIHLIGIGGTGMSAIARILVLQGYEVSGSDLQTNAVTDQLEALGATIYHGHDASHIEGATLVIASSAIKPDHVEIVAANNNGIRVYKRQDIMQALMKDKTVIAVAGTHGKTTTTSMMVHVLKETGHDPSYIVGGVMANTGLNADVGQGEYFVIEADEYDNMFHGIQPDIAIITSLEYDHPDFFKTHKIMIDAFTTFIKKMGFGGVLVPCFDDEDVVKLTSNAQFSADIIPYAIENQEAYYRATNVIHTATGMQFDVFHYSDLLGTATLNLSGKHNVLNALAVIAIANDYDIRFEDVASALATFKGSGRRFDLRDDVNAIAIIDDYAHHPTAIKTTIDAARKRYPEREVWAVWQPHTYSRTQTLWDDYLASFDDAHHVIVTSIYASREAHNPDVDSADFIAQLQHSSKHHAPTVADAVSLLVQQVKSPAVILIMSAGDAPQIGIDYLAQLKASDA